MKLRNLTPFLMLDHFHVSKGAVSDRTLFVYSVLMLSRLGVP